MSNPFWLILIFVLVPLGIYLVRRYSSGPQQTGHCHGTTDGCAATTKPSERAAEQLSPQVTPSAKASAPTPAGNANQAKPAKAQDTATKRANASETSHSASWQGLLPEDATLRRHYLTHVRSMVESLAPPKPSDSTLLRHHEQLIATRSALCISERKHLEALVSEYRGQARAA